MTRIGDKPTDEIMDFCEHALAMLCVELDNGRVEVVVVVGHGLAPCLEGGPNCNRSRICSSLAHCRASSTLTAFCRSAVPMESSVLEIRRARAVAARSTVIRYSLSPLDSPSWGFTWLAGFGIEDKSKILSVADTAVPWRGRRFLFGLTITLKTKLERFFGL